MENYKWPEAGEIHHQTSGHLSIHIFLPAPLRPKTKPKMLCVHEDLEVRGNYWVRSLNTVPYQEVPNTSRNLFT